MSTSDLGSAIAAIRALGSAHGRVSRTHIHKLLYLAEGWGIIPSRHSFTLYRFGPYSFDLDGELQALRSVGAIDVHPDAHGYGAHYSVGPSLRPSDEELAGKLRGVAEWLAPLSVKDLEGIATSEYFLRNAEGSADEDIVSQVVAVKPHLSPEHVSKCLAELKLRRTHLAIAP